MKVILILLLLTQICFGQVVLHRYTNKVTGDEEGLCYSSKDGNPAVLTPERNVEVIDESQKQFYLEEHRRQQKARRKAVNDAKKAKRKDIKTKLKGLGLSQSEVDELVGKSD